MLSREKGAIAVFRRVRDFLTEHAPESGYGALTGIIAQLDQMIARLESHAREQDTRTRSALAATQTSRRQALAVLREYMRPISTGAKTLFPADTAILAALQMPRTRDYVGLITAAESMAKAAEPYADRFIAIGLPQDFATRLTTAASVLRQHLDVRGADLGRRAASTAGLRQEYAFGRTLIRMLDAMVSLRLEATPARLAEWRSISRFARRGGARTEEVSPTTPSVPVTEGAQPEATLKAA